MKHFLRILVVAILFAGGLQAFTPTANAAPAVAQTQSTLITGGAFTNCAINHDHDAYCWGENDDGSLGIGSTGAPSATPVKVVGGHKFVSLDSDVYIVCGLTTDRDIYCWGKNTEGELGNGTTTDSATPVLVGGSHKWITVAADFQHTCGLDTNNDAYCWGNNIYGELGDGTTTSRSLPALVSGGHKFASLGGSFFSQCGLTADGVAYCWGANFLGGLGDGTTTNSSIPVAVTGGHHFTRLGQFKYASYMMCGIADDNSLWCWGYAFAGQFGDGGVTSSSTSPVHSGGTLSFKSIYGASQSICGILLDDTARCWGSAAYGGLGDGSFDASSSPIAVSGGRHWQQLALGGNGSACGFDTENVISCWGDSQAGRLGDNNARIRNTLQTNYTFLAGSSSTNCGLLSSGAAQCWGFGESGGLGDGGVADSATPVNVTGGLHFSSITTGIGNTCGLTTAGAAYCWGYNYAGQLGTGNTTESHVPVAVIGGHVFTSISGNSDHVCALTSAGAAWCWGTNTNGELGAAVGTSSTPVAVTGGHVFTSISAGSNVTCGTTVSGDLYCWGIAPQLGNGSGTDSSTPVPVSGGHAFSAVSAQGPQVCALTTAGDPYCWGTTTPSGTHSTPFAITGGPALTSIAVSNRHACGLTAAGAPYCWGDNIAGAVGQNSLGTFASPVAVDVNGAHLTSLVAGFDRTCGLATAGTVICWGQNADGALGTNANALPAAISTNVVFGNVPPQFTSATSNTSQSVVIGAGLASLVATDAESDTLRYTVASGSLPVGITLSDDGKLNGTVGGVGSSLTGVGSTDADIVADDGHGGTVHTTLHIDVAAAQASTPTSPLPSSGGSIGSSESGYLLSNSSGEIQTINGAQDLGSVAGEKLNAKIVGVKSTPSGDGYFQFAKDGGVFTFGDARFSGSLGSVKLNKSIVSMSVTPTGNGYWLTAADGGVFAFGDAPFYGSLGAGKVSSPIVAMTSTPSGHGYWLVAKNGAVYSFGDATYFGGTNGQKLKKPIVAIVATSSGQGYWLLASDGGVFTFGDAPFHGSNPTIKSPAVGIAISTNGYAVIREDGSFQTFA